MKLFVLLSLTIYTAQAQAPAPKAAPDTAPAPTPVASIMQLMSAMTIPASESLFSANDDPPKTDMDWIKLQNNALIIAEAGNLLMMPGRAKDKGEWMKHARALVDGGNAAYKAAQAKDLAKLTKVGDDLIYPVCEACHKTYLKR